MLCQPKRQTNTKWLIHSLYLCALWIKSTFFILQFIGISRADFWKSTGITRVFTTPAHVDVFCCLVFSSLLFYTQTLRDLEKHFLNILCKITNPHYHFITLLIFSLFVKHVSLLVLIAFTFLLLCLLSLFLNTTLQVL